MDSSIYIVGNEFTNTFEELLVSSQVATRKDGVLSNAVRTKSEQPTDGPYAGSLKNMFYTHQKKYKKYIDEYTDAFKIRSRWDVLSSNTQAVVYRDEGETRLRHMLDTLVTLNKITTQKDMPLSSKQCQWHLQMLGPSLPYIVGPKRFRDNSRRYLSLIGATEVQTNCFITAPRREGKTVGIAFYVACLLYAVPDAVISVFSQSQRASGKMMKEILTFYNMFPGARDSIIRNNAEELSVRMDGNLRSLFCYPAAVNSKFCFYYNIL